MIDNHSDSFKLLDYAMIYSSVNKIENISYNSFTPYSTDKFNLFETIENIIDEPINRELCMSKIVEEQIEMQNYGYEYSYKKSYSTVQKLDFNTLTNNYITREHMINLLYHKILNYLKDIQTQSYITYDVLYMYLIFFYITELKGELNFKSIYKTF